MKRKPIYLGSFLMLFAVATAGVVWLTQPPKSAKKQPKETYSLDNVAQHEGQPEISQPSEGWRPTIAIVCAMGLFAISFYLKKQYVTFTGTFETIQTERAEIEDLRNIDVEAVEKKRESGLSQTRCDRLIHSATKGYEDKLLEHKVKYYNRSDFNAEEELPAILTITSAINKWLDELKHMNIKYRRPIIHDLSNQVFVQNEMLRFVVIITILAIKLAHQFTDKMKGVGVSFFQFVLATNFILPLFLKSYTDYGLSDNPVKLIVVAIIILAIVSCSPVLSKTVPERLFSGSVFFEKFVTTSLILSIGHVFLPHLEQHLDITRFISILAASIFYYYTSKV